MMAENSNPYDPMMQPATRHETVPQAPASIAVFAVLNFVFAGLGCAFSLIFVGVLVYGIYFSGDTGEELFAGIAGTICLATPAMISIPVFLTAGIGLWRRRRWGFYFHLAGAILAAFTCLGIVYTVLAIVYATQPAFSAALSPRA